MIFNTTEIDNQIAQLKAERDRQTQANLIAEQLQLDLADLLDKLDEDAIAILKAELLALFPTVEPQPQPEDIQIQQDVEPENLTPEGFQAIQFQQDVEPEETISQRVAQAKGEYYQLTPTTNPAVAYFKRRDGELGHIYIGSMNQATLEAWGHWMHHNGYIPNPPELREAKRLGNWRYELKLPAMPKDYLEELIRVDYTRYPGVPRFIHQPYRVDPWGELAA